jgi:hypothetical protein
LRGNRVANARFDQRVACVKKFRGGKRRRDVENPAERIVIDGYHWHAAALDPV